MIADVAAPTKDVVPVVRILATDAAHFLRAFAGAWHANTLFLKNPRPLALGRKVRIEVATRDGKVLLAGDAEVALIVDAEKPGGPGNRVRFTRLEQGQALLDKLATPAGLRPAAPAPAEAPPKEPATAEWTMPDLKAPLLVPIDAPPPPAVAPPPPEGVARPPTPVATPTPSKSSSPTGATRPPTPTATPKAPLTPPPPAAAPPAGPKVDVTVDIPPPAEGKTGRWQRFIEDVQPTAMLAGPPPAKNLAPGAGAPALRVESGEDPPGADLDSFGASDRPPCFEFPELEGPKSQRMIGIDLGTAYSCAAYVEKGKALVLTGESTPRPFPSAVWADGKRYLVGQPAVDWIEREPRNVVHSWKRLLGRDFESEAVQDALAHVAYRVEPGPNGEAAIRIDAEGNPGPLCHPLWYAARVLYEIREQARARLNEVVEAAVITVPAHYTDLQRLDIRHAARLAGFETVRLITEPVAAAIAYGVTRDAADRTLLTYDFGGGTFDASVLEMEGKVFQVIATGGDPFLGGVDFDDRIMGHVLMQFYEKEGINLSEDMPALVRVAGAAERAKRELSERGEARIAVPFVTVRNGKGVALDVTVTRAKMEELCGDLVQRTLVASDATLAQASLSAADLDEVVLIGGMTRVPLVHRRVEQHFLRAPRKGVHPDEAVALGAAIFADSLGRDSGLAILDVVSLAVGVRAPDGRSFLPVIPARAALPVTRSHVVRADYEGQSQLRMDVFQGNSTRVALCDYVGTAVVDGLPPVGKEGALAEVQFRMTEDGTLALAVQDANKSGWRPLRLRYRAASARSRKKELRTPDLTRGVSYLRNLLGGR